VDEAKPRKISALDLRALGLSKSIAWYFYDMLTIVKY
jgi:hypothetical protein